jgi:hypothetical protein
MAPWSTGLSKMDILYLLTGTEVYHESALHSHHIYTQIKTNNSIISSTKLEINYITGLKLDKFKKMCGEKN